MSKNLKELAKMLQRPEPSLGIVVGEVISVDPYSIQYGDKIILGSKLLRFASGLIHGYRGGYTDDNGTSISNKVVTVTNPLEVGDQVILIPNNDLNVWFVIDRVVRS